MSKSLILLTLLCVVFIICKVKTIETFVRSKTYTTISSYNGVVVGNEHFYAINSSSISKHKIASGKVINTYNIANKRIVNMVGGAIVYGKLYICNSPGDSPDCKYNTVEVFDLDLNHKYFVELKGVIGSLVGIDYYRDTWWACFASHQENAHRTIICELYSPIPSIYDVNDNPVTQENRFETDNAYDENELPELPVNINIQVQNDSDIIVAFTESSKNDVFNKNVYYSVDFYTEDEDETIIDNTLATVETFSQVKFEAIGNQVYSTLAQTSSPIVIPLAIPYIKDSSLYTMVLRTSFDKDMLIYSSMNIGTHRGGSGIVKPNVITSLDDKETAISFRSKYILSSGGPTMIKDTCAMTPLKDDITKWTVKNRFFFPNDIARQFRANSVNGFSMSADGRAYITNNTNKIHVLYINRNSPNLIFDDIIHLDIPLHGIDWHKTRKLLYGVNGLKNEVVVYDGQ
jgi:hypothetical protein